MNDDGVLRLHVFHLSTPEEVSVVAVRGRKRRKKYKWSVAFHSDALLSTSQFLFVYIMLEKALRKANQSLVQLSLIASSVGT